MTSNPQQTLREQIQKLKAASSAGNAPPMADSESPAISDDQLDDLLDRINHLTDGDGCADHAPVPTEPAKHRDGMAAMKSNPTINTNSERLSTAFAGSPDERERRVFFPVEPRSLEEASLTQSAAEELVLKYLFSCGESTGQGVAEQIKLPFAIVTELLRKLKDDQLVHYRGTSHMNDYSCQLTESGRDKARRDSIRCTYHGAAPVCLEDYCRAVSAQSLSHQQPKEADLLRAFEDLLIDKSMLLKLGAAMNSGKGMFLFGYPGNGKTSIAERVTRAFGETIWIPRAIGIGGEIIRIFDPSQHEQVEFHAGDDIFCDRKVDQRWVQIRRPTIVAGGELTMANLELTVNKETGINEAPLQLKSNCGTLVIDDFGRQRMSTDELLNRWIVPLEKRFDFLNLPSGTKIEVPFDQLVIFSTNLEPRDLVDDAFLRRIPYKIEVRDPTEASFRKLFEILCPKFGFNYSPKAMDYLLAKHYKTTGRPLRCCHPRDILLQIRNYCLYTGKPMQLSPEVFDFAVENYFSIV